LVESEGTEEDTLFKWKPKDSDVNYIYVGQSKL
jgi:hypothetical protein